LEPVHCVGSSFRDVERGLVGVESDTVGELEVAQEQCDGPVGPCREQPTGPAVFQEVTGVVVDPVPPRADREVDRPVGGDGGVVREEETLASERVGELDDLSFRRHPQQALVGVTDDQRAGSLELDTEGSAAGVGDDHRVPTRRREPEDGAVFESGEHRAVVGDGDVFGTDPPRLPQFRRCERVVLGVDALAGRRFGGRPGLRIEARHELDPTGRTHAARLDARRCTRGYRCGDGR
jgi:hypothetical protein